MARIQTAGTVDAVRARFKVRETFELELIEGLLPVVVVDNISDPIASTTYPRDCMAFVTPGPTVAEFSHAIIAGQTDVGKVWKVTGAFAFKATAAIVQVRASLGLAIPTPDAEETNQKTFTDMRVSRAGALPDARMIEHDAAVIVGTLVGEVQIPLAETIWIPLNYTLGPDDWVALVNETANELLRVTYFWTEYLLGDV